MRTLARAAMVTLLAGCGTNMTTPDAPGGVTASFASLYGDYFGNCKNCHSPTGPGRTSDTEQTLDFTSGTTAYMTITTGIAAGLTGNFAGCNGVPFVNADPAKSLILAVLDQPTRNAFDLSGHPSCAMDTITDETAKVGSAPSAAFVAALKQWLQEGAQNN